MGHTAWWMVFLSEVLTIDSPHSSSYRVSFGVSCELKCEPCPTFTTVIFYAISCYNWKSLWQKAYCRVRYGMSFVSWRSGLCYTWMIAAWCVILCVILNHAIMRWPCLSWQKIFIGADFMYSATGRVLLNALSHASCQAINRNGYSYHIVDIYNKLTVQFLKKTCLFSWLLQIQMICNQETVSYQLYHLL